MIRFNIRFLSPNVKTIMRMWLYTHLLFISLLTLSGYENHAPPRHFSYDLKLKISLTPLSVFENVPFEMNMVDKTPVLSFAVHLKF